MPPPLVPVAGVVDVELRQAAVQRQIAHIGIGNTEFVAQRLVVVGSVFIDMKPQVAKAKVGEPAGLDHVVAARRHALIASGVGTREATATKARASGRTKEGRAGQGWNRSRCSGRRGAVYRKAG